MSERMITLPEMKDILPCKENMLLLDRVCLVDENKIIGLKAVTMNEPYFPGHFPGHPIVPGVLIVESCVQLAELAVWKRLDPERKNDIYTKSISHVKFRKPNLPGDRLIIEVDVASVENDEAHCTATVRNNSGVSCQAEFVLAVREKVWTAAIPAGYNDFDKSESCAIDVVGIMEHIPHRYPFLLVDYVSKSREDGHVTAVKNVTNSEPIFRCYKDGYQVLMGPVHAEILAQAGCVSMLANPVNAGKLAYFMGIESAEFFAPVRPGDQLQLEMIMPDMTKRFGKGQGSMLVDGQEVCRLSMSFAIVAAENKN